jgi:hypothetical protein
MKGYKKLTSAKKFSIKVETPISASFILPRRLSTMNTLENYSEKVLKFSEYAVDDSLSSRSEAFENQTEAHIKLKNAANSSNRLNEVFNPSQTQPNKVICNRMFPSLLSFQKSTR